mgnify:CR=1 FL=1|jgi:RNA polymerase sigma-70 factor (ECF subfamily)
MNNDTDQTLVRKVIQGETQLFAEIVERYQRPVYNLMYRYCRSEQEAADLSQDVFLRTFDRLASYNQNKSFFPWLYALAVNRANDWYRNNSLIRKRLSELQWEAPVIDSISEQEKSLLSQEVVSNLYEALDELSDISREMVLLRYRQELQISEIADIFDVSESAVKMRIARGLIKLKTVLRGEGYGKTHKESIAA